MKLLPLVAGSIFLFGCAAPDREPEPNPEPEPPQRACTMIGCYDGLRVEVNSSLTQPMTVTVRAGNQIIRTFQCSAGNPCEAFIENQTPAEVSVTVQVSGREVSRTYTPEYRMARPNGPDCPPECKQATVTLSVN